MSADAATPAVPAPGRGGAVDTLFVGHEASRTGAPLMFLYACAGLINEYRVAA